MQALQRAHQYPGLRLHAIDRRDDQHHAVENVQHPVHLGDEIWVPGCVDQIDSDIPDRERHHGGLDRDTTPPLQRQQIGLGSTRIDTAELVNDAGGVQQPLGESRLTRVYMRQDPQVERFRIGRKGHLDGRERLAHLPSLTIGSVLPVLNHRRSATRLDDAAPLKLGGIAHAEAMPQVRRPIPGPRRVILCEKDS